MAEAHGRRVSEPKKPKELKEPKRSVAIRKPGKRYRYWAAGIGIAALALFLLWRLVLRPRHISEWLFHPSGTHSKANTKNPDAWPSPEARLKPQNIKNLQKPASGPFRIYLDAGHGAPGNPGNHSCFCVAEQDFTRKAALELGKRLEETGAFEIKLSRENDEIVPYKDRVEAAEAWKAHAFISLHSDVRGRSERWAPVPGMDCALSLASPGFSVLWSDEGDTALADRRHKLAGLVARQMKSTGFLAYLGGEYTGLYEMDVAEPGVFVDRHAPGQRIFVLRKPSMPAILIETHHALDPREAARWDDAETFGAFAAAIAFALIDFFSNSINMDAGN